MREILNIPFQWQGIPPARKLSDWILSQCNDGISIHRVALFIVISKKDVWYRYVNDLLMISHTNMNIDSILRRQNRLKKKLQLTAQSECNGQLPFLDVILIRSKNNAKYKVKRKPTKKKHFRELL